MIPQGPGSPARRQLRASWSGLNRALYRFRVQAVRAMVDDEGRSVAETARLMGNARQVVSRLYHADVHMSG